MGGAPLALLCALALSAPARASAGAAQGEAIANVAAVRTAEVPAAFASPPAVVTVRIPTRSAIQLLQFAPLAAAATTEPVVDGAFRAGADAGAPYGALPPLTVTGVSAPLALPATVPLVPSGQFHQGDPIFVRVADRDQNLDRSARETIAVTLRDDLTGDVEVVRLTETGADTGVFLGWVPTATAAAAPWDGVLQVLERSKVTAGYVDRLDEADSASATAGLDVASRVFDSRTGAPLSGARITLVDAATGLPATVHADDGVSAFPSTIVSGQPVTDGAGRVHDFAAGEFRFPYVRPGAYRYEIVPPARYAGPSRATDAALQALPGAPFVLGGARGEAFVVDPGPNTHVDVPLDPSSAKLWVRKTAGARRVGVGDFLSYELAVTNLDAAALATGVTVVDTLPPGFRYAAGSARRDGAAAPDPAMSRDGRTLTFAVGDLAASATATLRLVVQVGAGARPGEDAVNRASAASEAGERSNVAEASVRVADELLSARSFLLGRVTSGPCADGEGQPGVPGVRVLLEDGTFAVSDKQGLFHFEGVRRGLHVVQLDPDSLPEGWEASSCTPNDRFAGRSSSQFVDVQGDTLWRADFHLRPRARAAASASEVTLALSHRLGGPLAADFHAEVRVPPGAPLAGTRLAVTLPEGLSLEPGSVAVGGAKVDAAVEGGALGVALGDLPAGAARAVTFRLVAAEGAPRTDRLVTAVATGAGAGRAPVRSRPAENALRVSTEEVLAPIRIVRRPEFPSFGAELRPDDREDLARVTRLLAHLEPKRIVVVGHTDSVRIAPRSRAIFADNVALSVGRARSVARVLREGLGLPADRIEVVGRGEAQPIADNATDEGRARNRRVELEVHATERKNRPVLVSVRDRSEPTPTPTATPTATPPPTPTPTSTGAPPRAGVLSPADGELVADRLRAVQVRLPSALAPALAVDGAKVDLARVGYKAEDPRTGLTTYTFVGVDLGEKGARALTLTGTDPFGNVRVTERATVLRTGEVAAIRLVAAEGNVADGKTPVRARIELLDASGDPILAATRLELRGGTLRPLRREGEGRSLEERAATIAVPVARDGTVEFDPVSTSGSYRALLAHGKATVEVEVWVEPKLREWVLVGLAEGTAGWNAVRGHAEALPAGAEEHLYDAERLALYAKGRVQGKWLLTVAYDSARSRTAAGDALFQEIDPEAYFTLYGDAATQGADAASARKLYVKLEREQLYAMFGDYDTGLTVTELSRYSRKLTGAKAEVRTRNLEATAFAARTDLSYGRDELPGDGTSGLYRLSRGRITASSETVTLVTRDRFRSEVVVESRVLARFTDYSVDYDAGTIFFREPVPSRDPGFNPITVVVEYETRSPDGEDATFGGRAGVKALDGRLRAGVSAVHEGQGERRSDLLGADVRADLGAHTRARAELAHTESRAAGTTTSGEAWLAELGHASRALDAKLYLREQEGGFGLGQQARTEGGTRKLGGEAAIPLAERLSLSGQAYRQDAFSAGTERLLGEARVNAGSSSRSVSGGVLEARDRLADGSVHESGQLTLGGKLRVWDGRLLLGLDWAQSVWGAGNADFPTRVAAHAEWELARGVTAVGAQELTWGDAAATSHTRLGLRATPWTGAALTTSAERELTEDADRVFGNVGLRQTLQLTEAWKVDAGAERSQTVRRSAYYQPNPAVPPASGTALREDFTALAAGATYDLRKLVWQTRAELRLAESDQRWSVRTGVVAERGDGWAWSGRGQLLGSSATGGARTSDVSLRLGVVYRPPRTRLILLSRLDGILDESTAAAAGTQVSGDLAATRSLRLVENALASWRPRPDVQVSLGYGAKVARERIGGETYSSFTDQPSLELRYDLSPAWDVGLRASVLHAWSAGDLAYSAGPSLGVSPATNVWLGVGFNVAGYHDRDFSAASATAFGPYVRVRLKFDQDSVKDAAGWLNRQ